MANPAPPVLETRQELLLPHPPPPGSNSRVPPALFPSGRRPLRNPPTNNHAPSKSFRILAFAALSVLCIYALVGMSLHTYDLIIDDSSSYGSWPFNARPAVTTLIILQSLLLLGVVFGLVGGWRGDTLWYFVSVLILLGDAAVLAVFGIVTLHASRSAVEPKLLAGLEKGGSEDFNWIDFIQYHHKCCGISSYSNWGRINGKLNPNEDGSGFDLSRNSVPSSCCKRDLDYPPPKESCGVDALLLVQKDWKEFTARIYVKPCGPEIIRPAREALINLGLEMLIAAFSTLAISLFLFCGASQLFCLSPKSQGRRPSRRRPGTGSPGSNATDEEDEDESDEDEDSNNENISKDESKQNGRKGQDSSGDRDDTSSFSKKGRHPRSRDVEGNLPPGSRASSKSKKKPGKESQKASGPPSGKDYHYLSPSSATKKLSVGGTGSKSKSKSKKSRQNEVTSKNKTAGAKGNILNNNVLFGKNCNKSPSRNSGTRSDMVLQKLEMLYVGVDKNTLSSLSTTPNPSGSLFFPWSNSNNNSTTPPPSGSSGAGTEAGTVAITPTPKLSTKTKGPQLSHYSSVPHFPHWSQHLRTFQPHHAHAKGQSWTFPPVICNQQTQPKSSGRNTKEILQESGSHQRSPIQTGDDPGLLTTTYSQEPRVDVDIETFSICRPDNVVLELEQGQDMGPSEVITYPEPTIIPNELEVKLKKSSQILLHIPDEALGVLPLVEVTNAINLIADLEGEPKDFSPEVSESGRSSESSPQSTGTSSTASVGDVNAPEGPVSNSSLGFENSASTTGTGESSESELEEEDSTSLSNGEGVCDGDLLTCRKSKVRFSTLPTIEEEPEPNTPKKESPTESELELKKNECIIQEQAVGDVESNDGQSLASSIANANVNVFGSSA